MGKTYHRCVCMGAFLFIRSVYLLSCDGDSVAVIVRIDHFIGINFYHGVREISFRFHRQFSNLADGARSVRVGMVL